MSSQRIAFRVGDSWCRVDNFELRSGVRLGVTVCQLEPSFSFAAVQPPSELELVVSKGALIHAHTRDGRRLERGGNTFQLGQSRSPLEIDVRSGGEIPTECASISISKERMRELLGAAELPAAFHAVTESRDPHALVTQEISPGLYQLLEEILHADAKGPSRLLWHEAKALELIALMTDELFETACAAAPNLCAYDIDRLERARKTLVENLETPPTLRELARDAGFSETKLKGGFRTLFGTSVFAYLRRVRMEEAQRLLSARNFNVTEVAQRVGYSNPSKFAAAFKRQFGVSPSSI